MKKRNYYEQPGDNWKDTLIPNFNSNFVTNYAKAPFRLTAFFCICLILFFIIFLRLFHLQIVKGAQNLELADGNRIQIKQTYAPRGVIFDRSGEVLAANYPAFRLFDTNLKRSRLITREEALAVEVKEDPRIHELEIDNVRTYPLEEQVAHIVGFVGEISEKELKSQKYANYRLGDRIGKDGIEAQYEQILKGIDGGEIVEVDSKGEVLRTIRQIAPTPGQNIHLTIDANLQKVLYRSLKETLEKTGSCCGAGVVIDPTNGQILALVSFPSFDPNVFTQTFDDSQILKILTETNSPTLNRVIAGTYPPGSTYKIVSALAALSSGQIGPDTIFLDRGEIYLGPYRFSNWYFNQYGRTEGPVNLVKAFQRSNDIYFYEIAKIIGIDAFVDWSKKLRLGDKLEIDLPGEVTGLVPTDDWKRETLGEGWYPGDTLHLSIGQGFLLTTPLQILGITSFIAGDGKLYKPQLLLTDFKKEILVTEVVSESKIEIIKKGLELVNKTGGTAWPFFTFPINSAGKTGTAEFGDPKNRTHAWYTAYAPADQPKIAATVLIEGGGEGSSVAAPVVKEVFRWYFSEDKNNLIKDVYPKMEVDETLGE